LKKLVLMISGPFIIIALVASTILYLNSSNQLRKKLLEIENIENAKKEIYYYPKKIILLFSRYLFYCTVPLVNSIS